MEELQALLYYVLIGFVIFCWYAGKTKNVGNALIASIFWPVWVGYILISLFWGIGSKL